MRLIMRVKIMKLKHLNYEIKSQNDGSLNHNYEIKGCNYEKSK